MDKSQENGAPKKGLKPIEPIEPIIMPNIFGEKTSPMTGDKKIIGRISGPPEFTKKSKD